MRKHVKGHLMAEIAWRAKASTNYVKLVLDGERNANTNKAQQIVIAGQILESALEKANKDMDKIFKK